MCTSFFILIALITPRIRSIVELRRTIRDIGACIILVVIGSGLLHLLGELCEQRGCMRALYTGWGDCWWTRLDWLLTERFGWRFCMRSCCQSCVVAMEKWGLVGSWDWHGGEKGEGPCWYGGEKSKWKVRGKWEGDCGRRSLISLDVVRLDSKRTFTSYKDQRGGVKEGIPHKSGNGRLVISAWGIERYRRQFNRILKSTLHSMKTSVRDQLSERKYW